MSKELKKFIIENRREFDEDLPPDHAWARIEESIRASKTERRVPVRYIYKWTAAAAVFFIIATCFYFLVIRKNSDEKEIANKEISTTKERLNSGDFSRVDPMYAAEAKKIYQSIELQQKQLKAIANEQPELYSQFSEDLAALDSSYRVLKAQAIQTPNREVIIRAMLQNLQLQAGLLAKQLSILNEIKNDKPKQNEKNNSPRI